MSVEKIEGPVFPIVTPFIDDAAADYPVDKEGLKKYVDYLLDDGAKIIMVASATTRFAQLQESEIREINEIVVKQVGDRGLPIASTGILGSTRVHIETAQHAEAIGAPVIACEYPWRYQNTEALVDYFRAIADNTKDIKIFLHVTPGRSELGGQYRYNVEDIREILKIPRVVGMKEAAGDPEISMSIWKELSDETSVIVASKGMQSFITAAPYGVSGYFVGTGNIVPRYSMELYEQVVAGNMEEAQAICDKHEMPFLNSAKAFGWHAALKAGMAEMGIMSDVERPPMVTIRPEERAELGKVMRKVGWI